MAYIINKNNKSYKYLHINDLVTVKFMFKNIIYFYNDPDENKIVGIDFEFYKVSKENKNASLIQINLENSSNQSYIFVFDPNYLTTKKLNIFIKFICSERIIKIIHGGEALDIPYLFDNLFNKNNKLIKKFLKKTYDTKFICQYLGLDKCNIYDLLYELNIIDNNTLNELNILNKNIGPIYEITLNINTIKLNKYYEEYVINDVLYLPSLYNKIKQNKYFLLNELSILQELTNINYYIKRNLNKNFNFLYKKINKMNNYFIIDNNNNKIKLIDFFYYYYYYQNNNIILLKYNIVTYFSQFIQTIIKCLLYKQINTKYTIYKLNNIKYDDDIDCSKIILKFPNINKIITTINFL
jgi:hypothetical protein